MMREVWERVFVKWRDTLAMGVPAFLFSFQNLLFFVSVSNLSATSYQLWSQVYCYTTILLFDYSTILLYNSTTILLC